MSLVDDFCIEVSVTPEVVFVVVEVTEISVVLIGSTVVGFADAVDVVSDDEFQRLVVDVVVPVERVVLSCTVVVLVVVDVDVTVVVAV